ncbi:hypothetical protein [Pseudonocardia sp. NPDC046786]|uniref:hypothetical protein n=1 Tax=Pseudonocardia sp. NPDC046786 TaxID=3155471 RepID=UPI0033DF6D2D
MGKFPNIKIFDVTPEELLQRGPFTLHATNGVAVSCVDGVYVLETGEALNLEVKHLALHEKDRYFRYHLRMLLSRAEEATVEMVGDSCYLCNTGCARLTSNISGGDRIASGCCKNCHAFSCGHHAMRDAEVPEYRCIECDPAMLAASARVASPDEIGAPELSSEPASVIDAVAAGCEQWRSGRDPADWAITDIDDFRRRRPGYGDEFFADLERVQVSFTQEFSSLNELPPLPQRLVKLALFVCHRFELGQGAVGRDLSELMRHVEWRYEHA